jgi:hypothetical protein
VLQEAQVNIVSNSDCGAAYGSGMITDDMLCAQGVNGAGQVTDACQGDSGGPLVCASGGAAYVVHGATSWGYGCAQAQYPGVWSRVSYVRDWIDELIGITPSPTPATLCADDDARAIALASGAGITISGCVDVQSFCEHTRYGSTLQATCPATCGVCSPCADDDARAIALASGVGITIGGCADGQSFCEHPKYGSTLQATCPVTCGSCGRRLAPQDDEVGRIGELTVVAPLAPAAAAEVAQKSGELSNSDINVFYP